MDYNITVIDEFPLYFTEEDNLLIVTADLFIHNVRGSYNGTHYHDCRYSECKPYSKESLVIEADKQTVYIKHKPSEDILAHFIVPSEYDTNRIEAMYNEGKIKFILPKCEVSYRRIIPLK